MTQKPDTLIDAIEGMRARLHQQHGVDMRNLSDLGETVNAIDRELLAEIDGIRIRHETRQAEAVARLRGLAERIGALPPPQQQQQQPLAHVSRSLAGAMIDEDQYYGQPITSEDSLADDVPNILRQPWGVN